MSYLGPFNNSDFSGVMPDRYLEFEYQLKASPGPVHIHYGVLIQNPVGETRVAVWEPSLRVLRE